jgi:hypothetical protein
VLLKIQRIISGFFFGILPDFVKYILAREGEGAIMKIFRKKVTPKELRRKIGAMTTSNETVQDLIEGVERQWRRYNDPEFQKEEFNKKYNQVFKKTSK